MKAYLEMPALSENLDHLMSFVTERLENADCPMKQQMKICVAVEEVFINIANYAYTPITGNVLIEMSCENDTAEITFTDKGVPYDPLAKEDPDISLPAEERPIGGLGILMVKKTMDDISYDRENDCNILTIKKHIK